MQTTKIHFLLKTELGGQLEPEEEASRMKNYKTARDFFMFGCKKLICTKIFLAKIWFSFIYFSRHST